MSTNTVTLPGGVCHDLPDDLNLAIRGDETAQAAWLDITPLARNEFICWIDAAKQQKTRDRRVGRAVDELAQGKRRPCCWPGCPHRGEDSTGQKV
ncbi:hypothetical protein F5X68DRAFT_31293 [Plectosphaerella plurivora]|uniref:Bacteriocin resistance YdeI/OmpD-like protein n=1 Tax=Plectosphaerella plurivora TaxID=936078 RepID=A0A9P8VJF7_9PEZI|nr:hypothetical protein F5X68DRAFT_31293 [Plectosphaerella plurivora]